MKYYRFLRSTYGLLILAFVISALTRVGYSSMESRLADKWKEKGGTEVLELFKDGRVSITSITLDWFLGKTDIDRAILHTLNV